MSDSDRHAVLNDFRLRVFRVEESITDMSQQMASGFARIQKDFSDLSLEIERQSNADLRESSNWKSQHAVAVANCNAKGEVASEAKVMAAEALDLARKAHRFAAGMTRPEGDRKTKNVSWGGLVTAIIALLTVITALLAKGLP